MSVFYDRARSRVPADDLLRFEALLELPGAAAAYQESRTASAVNFHGFQVG